MQHNFVLPLRDQREVFQNFRVFRILDLICGFLACPLHFQGLSPMGTRAASAPGSAHAGFHLSSSRGSFPHQQSKFLPVQDITGQQEELKRRGDFSLLTEQSACPTSSSSCPLLAWVSCSTADSPASS